MPGARRPSCMLVLTKEAVLAGPEVAARPRLRCSHGTPSMAAARQHVTARPWRLAFSVAARM
ncbi:hypothetical protein Dimus_012541, partial [Dionaea muscipula]